MSVSSSSLLLLFSEEDTYGSYARQLSKYFLAEGVVSSHAIFLASAEPEPNNILKVTNTSIFHNLRLMFKSFLVQGEADSLSVLKVIKQNIICYWFPLFVCQDLPQQADDKESKTSVRGAQETEDSSSTNQSMKIAWRYQNQPKFEVTSYFDQFNL